MFFDCQGGLRQGPRDHRVCQLRKHCHQWNNLRSENKISKNISRKYRHCNQFQCIREFQISCLDCCGVLLCCRFSIAIKISVIEIITISSSRAINNIFLWNISGFAGLICCLFAPIPLCMGSLRVRNNQELQNDHNCVTANDCIHIMVAILYFQGIGHCYVCDFSLRCRMWPTSALTATVWWDGTRPN